MLQSIVAPLPPWVAQRRLAQLLAALVLAVTMLSGPTSFADASNRPGISPSAVVSSVDQAVGRVVRHLTGKAARTPIQTRVQPARQPTRS